MRTGTVSYKLEDLRKGVIIPIGMVGENDFTRVIFDAEEVFKKHPDAQVTMKVQPPKGGIYPATVTRDGNTVTWQVKAADVAHRGSGELQLTFTADTMVEKSYIARTDIKRSLVGNGPAPDPVQDWVDNAEEVLEDLEAAEVHQPIIGLDGYWYTWNQGTGEYEKTNTKAQGQDGHSPVLTSSKSGKTTTIFADGDQLAQILDGEDGQGADVIDDTAGEGDTDKTWSADKLDTEITDVKTAIQGVSGNVESIESELYIEKGQSNLFDQHSDYIMLALNDTMFDQGTTLYGFYVPIDPTKGTTITIKRTATGQRFRFVSCQNVPAKNVTYENDKLVRIDSESNVCVYNKILPTDRYLYVAFYSTTKDSLTMEQLLAGMQIFYGTEFTAKTKISRLDVLDREKNPNFVNGKIDSSGNFVASGKHITSDFIRVDGKFGVSVPDDYVMKVHLFGDDYDFVSTASKTNTVSYIDHIGYVRFTIEDANQADITPGTVDFSSIKIPLNRDSAEVYTNKNTFVLDAENAMCDDVFAYIDEAVASHGFYAEKTALCTAFSIPLYYYTLGSGANKVMLIGGQHGPGTGGDPRDSVITLAKFMHDMINGDFENGSFLQTLHDEYTFLIIPILNGYGFNNRTRTNGDDVDLNRDWTAGNTTEVAAAKALITSFDPFMILDVHCNGTTPIYDADVAIQFGLGSHNTTFNNAVESKFKEYYDTDTETRWPNTEDTLQYYIITTLQKLGGLLELRWWTKSKVCLHDAQAESANYAMLVNVIKYCASVNDSGSYSWEKTPNQNQY